jgi:hypothetical protein
MYWAKVTQTRRFRILAAAVTLTIILAIAIPIIAFFVMRQRQNIVPKSNVLVPLYVYPAPGAWSPLHDV